MNLIPLPPRRQAPVHWSFTLFLCATSLAAQAPDLSEYRTVETAVAAKEIRTQPSTQPGFLGIHLAYDAKGRLVAEEVATDSPAARAGVQRGEVLTHLEGKPLTPELLRAVLQERAPGQSLRLTLSREGRPVEVTATLAPISRPQRPGAQKAYLGIRVESRKDGEGVVIKEITSGSPAERARLKPEEVILKVEGKEVANSDSIREILATKQPSDPLTLTLLLAEKQVEVKVILGAEGGSSTAREGATWDTRGGRYWTKGTYKLGIVIIEYPDVKSNPKVPAKAWEEAMFSKGTYKQTATGQPAYGSLYDYYLEQSYGHLKISGKAYAPIEVSNKRAEYGTANSNRLALLTEALEKLEKRDGKDALKDIEGLIFIYAGGRMNVPRGSLYWPHRSSVSYQGKRWPYFICGEGGERMGNISVYAHEFGHMLGLPDLYARPENPGSEGLAIWCAMSNQAGNGRPQHFSAWCKEKLNWITPKTIDPTVPQKLILAPIVDSSKECFKVLVRPDGSEYLLLENRRKKGFDASLPSEGLLIWRVVANRPLLEESHGVDGPAGPRVFNSAVPYPSPANDSFTPYTIPSSKSQLGGGLPVHITNIRRLADGRISFHIGYEYQ